MRLRVALLVLVLVLVLDNMIDAAKFACLINFGLFDYQRFSATTMLGFWLLLVGTRQYQLSPIANHKPLYGLATTLACYSVLIERFSYTLSWQ
jgi:apolipoprotein N-acyltransferase